MPRLSWPAGWVAAGAVAAALLAANITAPPVLAGSVAQMHAVRMLTTVSPSPSASPGADVRPPTGPGDLRACPPPPPPSGSFQGSVGLCWTASTDNTGVAEYRVYMLTANGFVLVASTFQTTAVVTGLGGDRTYAFYVVARDAAGNVSPPSALVSAPALGAGPTPTPAPTDTTQPTKPTGLQGDCVPDFNGTSLCWTGSTDDVGVTGYDVYRRTDTGWARVARDLPATARSFTEAGYSNVPGQQYMYFSPGRSYVYVVVAKDAAGNVSEPSDLVTSTVPSDYPTHSASPTPAATCRVEYDSWTWPGGFGANVKITNIGSADIDGWELRFAFPEQGQQLTSGYSATWSQSGRDVTAVNADWNATIKPGASVHIGFNGTHTGANPDPRSFTLNLRTCVVS
ncbi:MULTISPECIES: cellulose binding domain-containing protein [unclassified Microbispora]|uniref:cellulose binding domain-containing protein n=1 Tax=unclassified Microbispora TaxID=2614687 RepID=UPI001439AD3C|nr:cellulose binding domain-containing protein [Microbispora sp. SCL1-1]NJP25117.1 hypothetical protein [Microbispora sp. CL1-1]